MAERDDPFYVGWLERSPAALARHTRAVAVLLLAGALGVAGLLVTAQAPFDPGTFEFGVQTTVEGVIVERPYPLLLTPTSAGWRTHFLVASGKHGAGALVAGRDGKPVRLTGSRIYNDERRMIEVTAVEPASAASAERLTRLAAGEQRLGRMTLVGEIVDSKCHLGVMKPGRGKPHRACAVRCISGGIPPVLRVEDRAGRVDYLLLVDAEGEPVNDRVLDLVAEPVEITGEVTRAGDSLTLYAEPATYRRLGS